MERTFVVIFFFWAALTIITPALILLSENSKLDLVTNGEKLEGMKARSIMAMGYTEKHPGNTPIALPLMATPAPAPAPTPAPTLKPAALKARKAILTRVFLRSTDTGDDSKVSLRARLHLI